MPRKVRTYPLLEALELTSRVLVAYGGKFISKKAAAANSTLVATSTRLSAFYANKPPYSVSPSDRVHAAKAMAFLKHLSCKTHAPDSFEHGLVRLLTGGVKNVPDGNITRGDFAFVACVYDCVERATARGEFVKSVVVEDPEKYIGACGAPFKEFVKLTAVACRESTATFTYELATRAGVLAVFYSSDGPEQFALGVGDCFLLAGTIKDHRIAARHGKQETVFKSIEIIKNVTKERRDKKAVNANDIELLPPIDIQEQIRNDVAAAAVEKFDKQMMESCDYDPPF